MYYCLLSYKLALIIIFIIMGLNNISTGDTLLRPVWLRSRLLTFRKEVLTIDHVVGWTSKPGTLE